MELISLQPLWYLLILIVMLLGWRYSLVEAPLGKRLAAFLLRVLGLVLLILAICRPFLHSQSNKMHVVFLVDVSQSVSLDSAMEATDQIQIAIDQLKSSDSWSLFAVGKQIHPQESPEKLKNLLSSWQEQGADDRFRSKTNLSDALLESRLYFPAGYAKRLVLFSDGQSTDGELSKTLSLMDEEKIDVRLSRLNQLKEAEAAVVSIKPSTTSAFIGEVVRLSVQLTSNQMIEGQLRIIQRGVAVQEQNVTVHPDRNNLFVFDVDMFTPGASRWTAELIPHSDHFPINNQQTCTINVRGKPRILILHQEEQEMRSFERALEEQDYLVDVRGKFGVPESIQELLEFNAVVLADIPATLLTPRQMTLLNRYVKDFGGGLAMFGSENSYGLGGYHKTPVEEVLPLTSRFEKEKEKPSLAMALVVDKSGSMDGLPMELARQAAKSAVELLSVRDQIGVVGFDGEPIMISEMQSAANKDSIYANIDMLAADGGTNMFPAIVLAKSMLDDSTAKIKHMICLSDGYTQEADHESLAQACSDSGITISTVALGDADRHLLATIADVGRGRYYETSDPANVPQIFTRETIQASKSAIKEDLFGSIPTNDHAALTGYEQADLPFTLGYVMTQQKPTSQLLMITETGDPLLAISRFGLGVGMAYTSDLSEKWGGEWLAWSECGKFWAQVFRSMVRDNRSEGIEVQGWVEKDQWKLNINAYDSALSPLSQVQWALTVVDDQGKTTQPIVSEVGLGRYEAAIRLQDGQSLTARLRDPDTDKIRILQFNPAYPAEYMLKTELPEAVERLPSIDAAEIRAELSPETVRESASHIFFLLALLSLFLGNLIRRV